MSHLVWDGQQDAANWIWLIDGSLVWWWCVMARVPCVCQRIVWTTPQQSAAIASSDSLSNKYASRKDDRKKSIHAKRNSITVLISFGMCYVERSSTSSV